MKLSSRARSTNNRKLPAPIRNQITGTAIIEVPANHSFLVPVLTEDTNFSNAGGTQLSDAVLAVSVITVFPPHSRLAAAPALNEGTHAVPVFTVAGTLRVADPDRRGAFYDNPVRFTDISLIPRARAELRALLQQILREMTVAAAAAATGQPSPAAPGEGEDEGGQLIPVDFSAPRDRTSSRRAVRT